MNTAKLKSCPFCGAGAAADEWNRRDADEIERLRVRLAQAEADRESYKEQMIRAQLALHDAAKSFSSTERENRE